MNEPRRNPWWLRPSCSADWRILPQSPQRIRYRRNPKRGSSYFVQIDWEPAPRTERPWEDDPRFWRD
jgi:hypothetical protein